MRSTFSLLGLPGPERRTSGSLLLPCHAAVLPSFLSDKLCKQHSRHGSSGKQHPHAAAIELYQGLHPKPKLFRQSGRHTHRSQLATVFAGLSNRAGSQHGTVCSLDQHRLLQPHQAGTTGRRHGCEWVRFRSGQFDNVWPSRHSGNGKHGRPAGRDCRKCGKHGPGSDQFCGKCRREYVRRFVTAVSQRECQLRLCGRSSNYRSHCHDNCCF
jgi:hypothetical protein